MTQYTTKLALYKPGGGALGTNTPDEAADIDKLNGNFDVIDSKMGAAVVTSSTRPAVPFVGQQIYETNTRVSYVWSGSAWVIVSPPVTIFVQSSQPTANLTNDLWFW
jgi:hypothetical protein